LLNHIRTALLHTFLTIALLMGSGCATVEGPPNPDDPFESFNRSMFAFNETADKYVIKPVAEGYNFIMPDIASKGVTNFFSNVDDIVVFFNQLLQFKFKAAAATSARFVFNSTFGLLGLIDVATHMDLPKQAEDFGQTLAVWGVPDGPYLVLPFIGPASVRDTAGLAVDWTFFDPIFNRQTLEQSLVTLSIKYIDIRAGLLKASNILDDTIPDKYAFMRDARKLRREFLIYDGNPPEEFTEEELFEDEDLFNDEELLKDDDSLSEDPLLDEDVLDENIPGEDKPGEDELNESAPAEPFIDEIEQQQPESSTPEGAAAQ